MNIFKVYRVHNWYFYLGFLLIGFALKDSINENIFKTICLASFLLAYAYSLNDFYDKSLRKKYFLIPLFLTFLITPLFSITQILISITFLIIFTLYSLKPIRLKDKPFISSLCNGLGFSLLFLLGYSFLPTIGFLGLIFMLLLFSLEMVAQFIHEVVHITQDKKNNIITTAVFLGERKVKNLCYFFLFLALLISLYLFFIKIINILFFVSTLFFVIFFSIELFRNNITNKIRKKYRILGIIVGILYIISLIIA